MRRRRARDSLPGLSIGRRHAAIHDDAASVAGEFERQAAGMRLAAERERRRPAGVGDHDALAGLDALIAGVRGIGDRRAAGVAPAPLNCAKAPSPWRKKRSIGMTRSMALRSAAGAETPRAS